jgi:hypothetical protein
MKINYKELSKTPGYISLKMVVLKGIEENNRRSKSIGGYIEKFNPMGGKSGTHSSKFRWIIDRAAHYSYKTGIPISEILNMWEQKRSYSYRNYYQECNQPKLATNENILVVDKLEDLQHFKDEGFRCPACGRISMDPYTCNAQDKGGSKCDWKSYGLFGCLGKGLYVFVKEVIKGEEIFFPICLENK